MSQMLGLIPARGGSKRIPRKNLALLSGKPLLAWTIKSGLESEQVDRLVVSTEDDEIARVAEEWGAEVPFRRPVDLAQDTTSASEVLLHALNWFDEHEGFRPRYALLLQPTSPFRSAEDIDGAFRLAESRAARAVVSVTPSRFRPNWMKTVTPDGRLTGLSDSDGPPPTRRDPPQVYALNGAIYLTLRDAFLEENTFYTSRTYAYVMPPERSLDIDIPWDLYLANLIMRDMEVHEGG